VLAGTSSQELEDLIREKLHYLRALADGNWHIPIREKTMECSSGLRTAKDWSAENVSKEFPFF